MGRGRRNPKLVLAGLLCLALGLALLAWHGTDDTVPVLITVQDVSQGQKVASTDIAVAHVKLSPGVNPLPVDPLPIWQVALVPLPAGTLLVPGMLGTPDGTFSDQVRVAVVVAMGLAPVGALRSGSPVMLCGPDGQSIAAVAASDPAAIMDGNRVRFDVLLGLEDAIVVAGWVADGTLVVASP